MATANPFLDLVPENLIGGENSAPAYQVVGGVFGEVPKAEVNTPTEMGAFADLIPADQPSARSMEDISEFDDLIPQPKTETERALAETPVPTPAAPKADPVGRNKDGWYIEPGSIPDRILTWFGGGTEALAAAENKPILAERPPLALPIAKAIDTVAEKISGQPRVLQDMVETRTQEPKPEGPSFMNAGIPLVGPQEGTAAQIAAGVANVPIGFANFLLSPGGVTTMQGLGMLPKVAQTLVGLGFTAEQVKGFFEAETLQDKITTGVGATLLGLGTGIQARQLRKPASEPGAQPATMERLDSELPQGVTPDAAAEAARPSSEAATAREAEYQRMSSNLDELNKEPNVPIRSAETEIPRATETGQDQPGISGETRRGESVNPAEAGRAEVRPNEAPVANAAPESGLPPGFVSLGASTGADIPAPRVTAIKNSAVDKQRAERGELPLMEPARQSNPATWDEAMERIEKDPEHASKIVDGIRDGTKKGIDAADQMTILHEEIRLRNERTMEADRAADPYTTAEERAEASERFDKISDRINEVELAGHNAGTMSGRALQIRQQMIRDDYTPAGIERRMAAKKGGPLTEEEVAIANVDSIKIRKEVEAFEARVEQVKIEKGRSDAESAVKDMAKKSPRKPPKDNATEVAGIVDGIRAAANEGAVLGGQLDNFVKRLAKKFVEGGMRGLDNVTAAIKEVLEPIIPKITARNIQDAFSDYGQSKPATTEPAKVHLSQIRGEAQKTSALQDIIEKQKAPLATGPQRVQQSEISRRLTKLINEAKKKFNIQPTDPARALKTALESRKTYYTNKLADLRFEIAKGERIIKEKNLPPTDPALEALKAEYGRLKKEHLEIFGKRELTPEQRLKSAITVAERAELEAIKRLENAQKGIFGKEKTPSKVPPSVQLDAIRARTEAIREQVKELHDLANPKKTPEERALQSYKTRLKTQEAELLEKNLRADAGDASVFEKKTRTPLDISKDPQAMALKATVEKSKQELARKANAYALAHRTFLKKIKDGILMTYDASTNLLSAFDLSAPRQAAFGLATNAAEIFTHPRLALRPFKKMFQVLTSDARSRRFEQERLNRPNALNGVDRQAKVEYTALDETKFSKKEENARSVLDEWAQIPLRTGNLAKTAVTLGPKLLSRGVHISNRAFNAFLNTMRADLLDHLLAINFKDRAPTKVELEAIGNIVNVSTGRGKLRPATTEVAGRILWSPKLLASRIQILAGQPFYRGTARTRKIVAKQYAKAIGTGIAIWKVQQMFSDRNEEDSRSSDFGKMIDGATRLDIWGGLQQVLVQEERQRTGQTKTAGGKVLNLRDKSEDGLLSAPLSSGEAGAKGTKQAYGQGQIKVAADFLRTKLRPQLGAFVNWATGKNIIGEKTTAASLVKDLTVSLAWKDIVELLKEQGMTQGAAYQAAQIFGAGVSTYTDKKEQKKEATSSIR